MKRFTFRRQNTCSDAHNVNLEDPSSSISVEMEPTTSQIAKGGDIKASVTQPADRLDRSEVEGQLSSFVEEHFWDRMFPRIEL